MDPLTLAGTLGAFVIIIVSMVLEGGNPAELFLPAPILLVFGGTILVGAAGMMKPDFIFALKSLKTAMLSPAPEPPDELVATLVKSAEVARRDGLLALEAHVRDINDPFLKKGLELAVDGTDPEELAGILEAEAAATKARNAKAAKLYQDMGGYAPTIGIIGTVLGLVHVLSNLSEPSELGELIAAAFIATLWGVLSANVFWLPIASKLKSLNEVNSERMELVIEGILAIQAGSNPRMVDRKLRALLPDSGGEKPKAAA
jgi:chemotaxis protein MotA